MRLKKGFIIVLILVFLSVIGPILQPLAEVPSAFFLFLLIGLMAFPGSEANRPRFFKVLPWFWGLEWLASIFVLFIKVRPVPGLNEVIQKYTWDEILSSLIFIPILFWSFLKKPLTYPVVQLIVCLVSIALGVYRFTDSGSDQKEFYELIANGLSNFILIVYVYYSKEKFLKK